MKEKTFLNSFLSKTKNLVYPNRLAVRSDIIIDKTAAVCIARDVIDVVPLLCGHYLRVGFRRIHFIDDCSSDGTYEFISMLSTKTDRITVSRDFEAFDQSDRVSRAVNELVKCGYRVIFPFDADEFWNIRSTDLRLIAELEEPRVIQGQWLNFVQKRDRLYPRPLGLLSICYSASEIHGTGMNEVVGYKRPFVAVDGVKKVAFWTNEPIRIGKGQHELLEGPARIEDRTLEIFHVPLRYASEITKRALNYEPRRVPLRSDPESSWQSHFHRHCVLNNLSEAVWRANSADKHGYLDGFGQKIKLCRDVRLRKLLFLSSFYLFLRFGLTGL
jgi:glycosyltransferase involved in cell wall biosynthesis